MVILDLRKNNFTAVLSSAVKAIKSGRVLICPTDTVYGMVGDFSNKKVIARMYAIKKRSKSKPFLIFVGNVKEAKNIARINSEQEKFLKTAWPGAVTCVLRAKKGNDTIGVRIPNHRFALNLVRRAGPLVQTSANISGQSASTKISEVLGQFEGKKNQPDLIVNVKDLPRSLPSTIIDLTTSPFKILRQ